MKRITILILSLAAIAVALFVSYRMAPTGIERPAAGQGHVHASTDTPASSQKPFSTESAVPISEVATAPGAVLPLNADLVASSYDASDTPSPAAAAPKTWKRNEKVSNSMTILVGDDEALELQAMQTSVRVDGFRARVMIDAYFYSEYSWAMEGRFKLRLPNGATPFYLAFGGTEYESPEVGPGHALLRTAKAARAIEPTPAGMYAARANTWTDPKEARMVTRGKAALAFRETVRQQIDPALLEWSGPGMFSAALYPIEPEQLHHVVIGYDVDLVVLGDALELTIPTPEEVGVATVDLDVSELAPVALDVSVDDRKLAADLQADGHQFFRVNNANGKTVVVRQTVKGSLALTGTDTQAGDFFAARVVPTLPATEDAGGASRAVFMLDTSLSSNPDQFNVWVQLLEATLVNNQDRIEEFAVLTFDVDRRWWKQEFVANNDQNVKALMAEVNTLALEGATDLSSALTEATSPAWKPAGDDVWDVFLLSDGGTTWGEDSRWALSTHSTSGRSGSIFGFHTGLRGGNRGLLEHLASETGGAVFSVTGESEIRAASTAFRARPWFLTDVAVTGGSDLLLGGAPRTIYPGQSLLVVGRGTPDANGEVVLTLSERGNESPTVVNVPIKVSLASPLAARTYGTVAVGQLEAMAHLTEVDAAAYARHFRVVGKSASLVMLETVEDYEAFDIASEDDGSVVSARQAAAVLAEARGSIRDELMAPKARFMAWFDRLEKQPGVHFYPTEGFRAALADMPRTSFEVPVGALDLKVRAADQVPAELREAYAARSFDAEAIEVEAERRRQAFGNDDAIAVLSSLIEEHPGNPVVARDVAYRALAWERPDQAFHLFRKVAEARPHEPQTYHGMALALAESGHDDLAMVYFEVALAGRWDDRFGDFRTIVTADYLRFLRGVDDGKHSVSNTDFADTRQRELSEDIEVERGGMLVSMAWNTDQTDVDLHVVEPNGEECYYSHPNTEIGGHITRDVTQGYGPEMYTLSKPIDGTYAIKAKYYASDLTRATTRTRVYVTIFRDWGTDKEQVTREVVVLESTGEVQEVMALEI